MANDLQEVAEQLIVDAAIAFRNMSQMPMLVARNFDAAARQKFDKIEVPIWRPKTIEDVTPGTLPTPDDLKPDTVEVVLDQWKQTSWVMNDKEVSEVMEQRVLPKQVELGLIALADNIDLWILQKMYQAAFSLRPFSTPATEDDIVDFRMDLNVLRAPRRDRKFVTSDTVEAELLKRDAFKGLDKSGSTAALREGSIGRASQFEMFSNGQLPLHTKGNPTGWTVNGAQTQQKTLSGGTSFVNVTAGTGSWNVGDRLLFAGHAQKYSVVSKPTGQLEIAPRLQANISNAEAISIIDDGATHQIGGLAFWEGAFVFALRPLSSQGHPAVVVTTATDPVTNVSMRLEVTRGYKQNLWALDVLWGGKVIYPEAIIRGKD